MHEKIKIFNPETIDQLYSADPKLPADEIKDKIERAALTFRNNILAMAASFTQESSMFVMSSNFYKMKGDEQGVIYEMATATFPPEVKDPNIDIEDPTENAEIVLVSQTGPNIRVKNSTELAEKFEEVVGHIPETINFDALMLRNQFMFAIMLQVRMVFSEQINNVKKAFDDGTIMKKDLFTILKAMETITQLEEIVHQIDGVLELDLSAL